MALSLSSPCLCYCSSSSANYRNLPPLSLPGFLPPSNPSPLHKPSTEKWRAKVSFFPAFLNKGKGKDAKLLKEELLQAIEPLDRGARATIEDQQTVDQVRFLCSYAVLGTD